MASYTDKLFDTIKRQLDEYDYSSLLAQGAPRDEFDGEAREIYRQISVDSTTEKIAATIAKVFSESFNTTEHSDTFLTVAQKIKSELSQN